LAAAIQRQLGADTELVAGSKGIFDVSVDGKLIYSKYDTGRFPEAREIFAQVQSKP
jgi:selenoprotein W-related protein